MSPKIKQRKGELKDDNTKEGRDKHVCRARDRGTEYLEEDQRFVN
jgi:hypothetical protein